MRTTAAVVWSQRLSETGAAPGALLICAGVELDSLPNVDKSNLVIVPEEPRRAAEASIEEFADLAGVALQSSRILRSPYPDVALVPSGATESKWLESRGGISVARPARLMTKYRLDLSSAAILAALDDRRDGLALLAEALSNPQDTGRFRELLRLFERAFRLGPYDLIDPLATYLSHYARLNYTHEEIHHWLADLRSTSTHADRRDRIALAADVQPVIMRVEQAAYDVLLNKEKWRSPNPSRRDVWQLPAGVLLDGSMAVRADKTVPVMLELLDSFGAYGLDLAYRIHPLPAGWWAIMPKPGKERQGPPLEVVESLTG